jgi:glycosyltransferase involved in cell wall biosynthesis
MRRHSTGLTVAPSLDASTDDDQLREFDRDTRLSVVLPAVNEEDAVGEVVAEIWQVLQSWPHAWEILVVDDGSRDNTAQNAAKAGARVVCRAEQGGYGAAVKTGIRAARGEWIALLDADGSYDAAELPLLIQYLPAYDQVNGARQRECGRWSILRRFTKDTIRVLAQWISGKRIPDLNTGMKVFKRDVALDCLWALPDGFSASTSLTLAFLCDGRLVKYVPVSYRKRVGLSKFRPISDTFLYVGTVLRLILYFRPLRVFLPLAGVILFLAIPSAIWHMFVSPSGFHDADVMLFGCAALTAVCGMLAELIVAQRRGQFDRQQSANVNRSYAAASRGSASSSSEPTASAYARSSHKSPIESTTRSGR